MLYEDYSNKRHLREACYSLLLIAIGFLSCSIIAMLAYYTYQAIEGNISYCSLWTDIPGRLALFLTLYYAAGICGTLPIPECFRVNWLPPPFILYRLESWNNLLVNLCLHFTSNYRGYEALENDPEMSPPRNEYSERDHDCSPTPTFYEESKNIQISETDTPKQSIVRPNLAARYRDVETASSSEEYTSFDSSISDDIFPNLKGKSSKPCYIPDSSISSSESTEKSLSIDASSDKLCKVPETLNDKFKSVTGLSDEYDTPPRTPEIELTLSSFPRAPWGYLKEGSGLPYEAKALHKRNLMAEKQEIHKYNEKGKVKETTCSPKNSERRCVTDSDEFNLFTNRPFCISPTPPRTETSFRGRTKSIPENIEQLGKMKTKIHKRICSCSPPYRYRPYSTAQMNPESEDNSDTIKEKSACSKNSSDIQTKVEHIQKSLMKYDPSFQTGASTSRQSIDFPSNNSNGNTGGEALTSTQNIHVSPTKMPDSDVDAEASASRQNADVFPSKISDRNAGGKASNSKQDINNCPSKISAGDETSTSK